MSLSPWRPFQGHAFAPEDNQEDAPPREVPPEGLAPEPWRNRNLLATAALSHLHLALVHLSERERLFEAEDRKQLSLAIVRLRELAQEQQQQQDHYPPSAGLSTVVLSGAVAASQRTPLLERVPENDPQTNDDASPPILAPPSPGKKKNSDARLNKPSELSSPACRKFAAAQEAQVMDAGELARLRSQKSPSPTSVSTPEEEATTPGKDCGAFAALSLDPSRTSTPPCSPALPGKETTPSVQSTAMTLLDASESTWLTRTPSKDHVDPFHLEPWQASIIDMFKEIDQDDSGCINSQEVRQALQAVGIPAAQAKRVARAFDANGDGKVSCQEWLDMIVSGGEGDHPAVIKDFIEKLRDQQAANGRIYPKVVPENRCLFWRHDSTSRMGWDIFLTLLLFYISIMLPFVTAFGSEEILVVTRPIDNCLDAFFCLDIIFNFRTSYLDATGDTVCDGFRVAVHYVKTWFLLDLVSSIPLQPLSALALPDLQPAKLLKIGKITKAFKMLRIGKMLTNFEFVDEMDELVTKYQVLLRSISLLLTTAVVCHWLACCMNYSGPGFLDKYNMKNLETTTGERYLAALYWAMTTMTTVGYGDITPGSDWERIYSILAMIIGGSFYAYCVGCITSVVSARDANSMAYVEQMERIQAWLAYHEELPVMTRKKIRRHLKRLLLSKTALDDAAILNDLSPELRHDVAGFLISDDVRYNLLFDGLPRTALARLAQVIQKMVIDVNDRVVSNGEPGIAMFMILEGQASLAHGDHPDDADTMKTKVISVGDSFGEEIILQLEERYRYTVTATTRMVMNMISESTFNHFFEAHPDVIMLMKANFAECCKAGVGQVAQTTRDRGRASISGAGKGGVPGDFPDAVFDALQALAAQVDRFTNSEQNMFAPGLEQARIQLPGLDLFNLPPRQAQTGQVGVIDSAMGSTSSERISPSRAADELRERWGLQGNSWDPSEKPSAPQDMPELSWERSTQIGSAP